MTNDQSNEWHWSLDIGMWSFAVRPSPGGSIPTLPAGHPGLVNPMTPAQFRKIALSLPEAIESAHMGHPDFRVGGKIFATLSPTNEWGMVKLTPEQQREFVASNPDLFEPFNGAWGRSGCTKAHLGKKGDKLLRSAIVAAWQNIAPQDLKNPDK
jgi:hypothetical protein